MIQGNFIVIPLAADGKIAIGQPTVGVRVRMLGTELSHTVMDKTGKTPFWQMKDKALDKVRSYFVSDEQAGEFHRGIRDADQVLSLTHAEREGPVVVARLTDKALSDCIHCGGAGNYGSSCPLCVTGALSDK